MNSSQVVIMIILGKWWNSGHTVTLRKDVQKMHLLKSFGERSTRNT